MRNIWDAVSRFFERSHNDRLAELLMSLVTLTLECAGHFRKTEAQDLPGIIAFEHRADAVVDEIHELLDNAFIMRFDIADAMRLTDEVDDVIDGMRKVAIHVDIYKPFLSTLRPEAKELMAIGERMVRSLGELIAMLSEPRLSLARVREIARVIDEAESEADNLLAAAERKLVAEFSPPGANRLEFIAWDKLYNLLEQVTDDANRSAKLVLSMARKEA